MKFDVLVAAALFSATVLAFIQFELCERFFEYSRRHEDWKLDEFAASIPALAIAMVWFASRRWREARNVSSQLESSMRQLSEALEGLAATRERTESASDVKSVFLSLMREEIRKPANGIIEPVKALLHTDLSCAQYEQATKVLQSSQSLIRSIDDILELSELESTPMTVARDRIELEGLLVDVENDFVSDRLDLSIYVDPILPAMFHGDRERLRQVLFILLDNARKFTDSGGIALSIRLESAESNELFVRFEVRDTGTGIETEYLPSIFEPFLKVTPGDRQPLPGMGLGLAICKKVVTGLGGRVGADSQPGSGSTFWFTIPLSRASDPLDVDARELLRGLRVLIVDNLALTRETLAAQVSAWGAIVETTAFGVEAMATLRQAIEDGNPFDVALFDSKTAGDGTGGLVGQIHQEVRLESLAVILLTPRPEGVAEPHTSGPKLDGSLAKPVHPERLKAHLLELMRNKAPDAGS